MAHGFLSGVFWGTVVGGVAVSALSLLTELPPGAAGAPEIVGEGGAIAPQPVVPTGAPSLPSAGVSDEELPLIGLGEPAAERNPDAPEPERTAADAPEVDTPGIALEAPETNGRSPDLPRTGASAPQPQTEPASAPMAPAAIKAPVMDTSVPERPAQNAEPAGDATEAENRADTPPETRQAAAGATAAAAVEQPTFQGHDGSGALARNAVPFENPDAKPLYSIILIDAPGAAFGPAEAAELGFPVTFALDPTARGAAARAEAFRAAGHEVLLILPLPQEAGPVDAEIAFERASSIIPGAVGVLDAPENGFGPDHMLTQRIVSIVAQSGHGLIGHGRGLGWVAELAQRGGVPSALSFRVYDDERQSVTVIRRYLDRAASRAQREGHVVMVGHMYPDSIRALMEWAIGEGAAGVALAPVSAVMRSG